MTGFGHGRAVERILPDNYFVADQLGELAQRKLLVQPLVDRDWLLVKNSQFTV